MVVISRKINEYVIDGNTVVMKLKRKNGDVFDCLFDLEDLEKVLQYRWHARYNPSGDAFYAHCTFYLGTVNGKPKYESIHMNKVIMNIPKGRKYYVDHKNHNTLDNRKSNLRIATVSNNSRHRGKINSNNSSGYRNVSWDESRKKWMVQLQVNGKNKCLGIFDNVDEASEFAEEMRQQYYKNYKGV